MPQVYVKLMNRGLKSEDHDKFSFQTTENATVGTLVDELHKTYGPKFEVFLDEHENQTLRRDAIVIVNGQNMVAHNGLDTNLSDGDMIVFMIAAVGG
jgi:molybdopterin converting factor small subunit